MQFQAILLISPALLMMMLLLLPSRMANENPRLVRTTAVGFLLLSHLVAFLFAVAQFAGLASPIDSLLIGSSQDSPLSISCFYDNITALMLLLVSFIGLITGRYSVRYLDGESSQGQYFKWLSVTVGAVYMMVLSGNLLMFCLAWVATSLGLHRLLTHYQHRPQAKRAAWTKFAVSRLGDVCLIFGVFLIFETYGTLSIPMLLEQARSFGQIPTSLPAQHGVVAWLLVLGAAIKTAQVPFHTWLPDTLETPTPVSALMHAGIVNAGGYLLIRLSPLVLLAPSALQTLAVMGTVTACLGVVVMTTQTSVKKTLAYSTVAQMGFMMLQCGLGAFSLAMLHILAHSMYKAHAFLGSGTIDFSTSRGSSPTSVALSSPSSITLLATALIGSVTLIFGASYLVGINLSTKPGGYLLGFIMVLALSSWAWKILLHRQLKAIGLGLSALTITCWLYMCAFQWVDVAVNSSNRSPMAFAVNHWLGLFIATAFACLFLLHLAIVGGRQRPWLHRMRIHASNGFYIGTIYQRWFANPLAS